ncbi:tetratricopeptide repeat protein [Rugamonas apoptosis]|uniref:Tetratricopeptide repeat protein n=1 Tax=Rugamonas apoptosis TaxID=2758570 RepID=A0A7W2FCJ1_9BURK|nr:tetratricopeptide repeat protein [Rugamonas apoptosis]MBA5689218.1 tetratricopeptide repeat protein [Rugamonas apoptosis]
MTALKFVRTTLIASALALSAPVFAADPTMHEVYLAAEAGKYTEAQAMMDQVLRDHPNSGKAHFVEAELLAKQGKMSQAQAELSKAEQLAPGLPFAKPGTVEKLRLVLSQPTPAQRGAAATAAAARPNYGQQQPAPRPADSGLPWGMLLILGAGLVGFIVLASRFMSRRQAQAQGPAGMAPYAPGAPQGYNPGYGQPQGWGQQGANMGQPQGPGMGSRIMGGLATGAAVGAGVVAGEALMRHFTEGDNANRERGHGDTRNDIVYDDPAQRNQAGNDMGGNDFGVSDSGSWDDNSGGGGGGGSDDW